MNAPRLHLPTVPEPAFAFGEFRLEPGGTLLRADVPVHLPPKELSALRFLLSRAGQIVTPAQLKRELWGPVHVTSDSVAHCISSLCARLSPEDRIQTVYKRGYRWVGTVRRIEDSPDAGLPRLAIVPFTCAPEVSADLGERIAEDAASSLTRTGSSVVRMLARDSAFMLARRGLTAHQVGQSLHADLVLAGTLRPLPVHFRLRAEMVRVSDGTQIWVEETLLPSGAEHDLFPSLAFRIAFRLGGELAHALPRPWQSGSSESDPVLSFELAASAAMGGCTVHEEP